MSAREPDLNATLERLVKAFLVNVAARYAALPEGKPPPGTLERLLAEHVLFGKGVGTFGTNDDTYVPLVTAAHSALAQHGVTCFADASDVHHFLLEQFFACIKLSPLPEDLVGWLVGRFGQPLRAFEFEFPFPPAPIFQPEGWKSRPGPLRLTIGDLFQLDKWSGSGLGRHAIKGKLVAWGWYPATQQAATLSSEFLGTCLALRLGRLIPDQQDFQLAHEPTFEFDPPNPVGSIRPPHRLTDLAARFQFTFPMEATDLEIETRSVKRYELAVTRLFSKDDECTLAVRNASRLFALAQLQDDPGAEIAEYFVTLEAVLLEQRDKEGVTGRLREAIAFRLGRSPRERTRLRELVARLYDARSKYVHTGRLPDRHDALVSRDRARELAREVLREEIFGLLTSV